MEIENKVLRVDKLSKSFSQNADQGEVLDEISYSFKAGRSYSIAGASGSGKSTLLHVLAGLETPTKGKLLFNNKNLYSLSASERAQIMQADLGIVFQTPYLLDELSLCENVMIKGLIAHMPYQKARMKALELLKRVGLESKESQQPRSLSGGEQQRVVIARALFSEPSFILADEPTAHLDKMTAQAIISLLVSYQKERHVGLIIASHDTSLQMLDISLELSSGSLREMPLAKLSTDSYQVEQYG